MTDIEKEMRLSIWGLFVIAGDHFPSMECLSKEQVFENSRAVENFCRCNYHDSGGRYRVFLVVDTSGELISLYPSDCDC